MTTPNWPSLPSSEWADTLEALHLWSQVIGKVRLAKAPWLNHSWSVTLAVSPRGLRTGLVPAGDVAFELELDLVGDRLLLTTSRGDQRDTPLTTRTVADFHATVLAMLDDVGVPVAIHPVPNEIPDAIPFDDDHLERPYDPAHARALLGALLHAERVMQRFRSGFRGKASPVHFFWGSFDLAVTRFSGRTAPPHGGGIPNFPDDVAREAYSHEVTSVGFWPGNRASPEPIFYAYAYPAPDGFASATVAPAAAFWLDGLGEFALPYDAVASSADPDGDLLAFFESTHAAAADLAEWDRRALECNDPHGPDWWRTRPHAEPARTPIDDPELGDVVVRDDRDRHRYVIELDGRRVGMAVYQRTGDRTVFVHTEIDPSVDGRGLGSQLVRAALDDVDAHGGTVVPLCPFVRSWIERHSAYDRLVDHVTLDRLLAGS